MTHMTLQAVRQLIANDSYAITFQSTAQYRTTLLRHFDSLTEGLAATQHAAAPGALDGWRLVPERATPEMLLAAGYRATAEGLSDTGHRAWTRLLAAAPSAPGTPEAAEDEGCKRCDGDGHIWGGGYQDSDSNYFSPCPDCQGADNEDERAAQLDGGQGEGKIL